MDPIIRFRLGFPATATWRTACCAVLSVATLAWPSVSLSQPVGLPNMGAASAAELSPRLERQLGDAIMMQGRRDPTYIHDLDLTQYLNEMGQKLVRHASGQAPDISLFGVRDPSINAFAMPGGYIGIHSGLFTSVESESELAGVTAHEIGHVAQRHIARGLTQQAQNSSIMMASMAAALLAALAGSVDLAQGVAVFGQAAAIDRQLGFSRDAEREADRAGFDMLRKAGYDPAGMAQMFQRLMNSSRLNEGMGGGAYASTHPLSIQRMSDIQNRMSQMTPSSHVSSDDFWYLRAKLRVLQALDAQSRRLVMQQLQQEAQSLSGTRKHAAWFGLAVEALRRKQADEAEGWLNRLAEARQDTPYAAGLRIELAQLRGQNEQAVALARAAVQRWPQRQALQLALAEALYATQHFQELERLVAAQDPGLLEQEPRFRQLQALAQDAQGNLSASRRTMAEFYIMTGAYPAAVSQLHQARAVTDDFYVQSQIDARIRQVQELMDSEKRLREQFG